jgi:hypothetical protein
MTKKNKGAHNEKEYRTGVSKEFAKEFCKFIDSKKFKSDTWGGKHRATKRICLLYSRN